MSRWTESAFLESCMYRATEKPRQSWRHCVGVGGEVGWREERCERRVVRHLRRREGSRGMEVSGWMMDRR